MRRPLLAVILQNRSSGGYTGTVSTPLTGDMPVQAVTVQGNRVRITAHGQTGEALLNLLINGSAFTGSWSYAGATGDLTGRVRQ